MGKVFNRYFIIPFCLLVLCLSYIFVPVAIYKDGLNEIESLDIDNINYREIKVPKLYKDKALAGIDRAAYRMEDVIKLKVSTKDFTFYTSIRVDPYLDKNLSYLYSIDKDMYIALIDSLTKRGIAYEHEADKLDYLEGE